MSSSDGATAQTSFFQSYNSASPTPFRPLDETLDDGMVRITVGTVTKRPEECTVTELKHWLKNRRSRVGGNTLAVSGTKQVLIGR